ncbi:hypothetical protein JL09_g52 [Pichia kudriavzevii]|uniref:LSM domain-containing protein n=1 Tax=Pichia kudriavzevii TaxID=4909 RepID=A0A099P753_PICKU|nr:hypothetical protein JL09_g52 [Pichia kudriavzevii]
MSTKVSEPLDLIKQNLDEQVFVKLRGYREMVGDATEKIYAMDEDTGEISFTEEKHTLVFVRGDSVIVVTDATQV